MTSFLKDSLNVVKILSATNDEYRYIAFSLIHLSEYGVNRKHMQLSR